LIKDRVTKKVLLHGPCKDGLYPLPQSTQRLLLLAIKSSSQRWHCRLGHPSRDIIHHVLRSNNISCSGLDYDESICDACLRAKAHQVPFPRSLTQSTTPLQLVFSDVWGPSIDLFGNKKYYISFIDGYSNFTWLYLLHCKSKVFNSLRNFNALLNECLITKLLLCRLIGLVNMSA
jgi:hypothetical protein